MREMIFGRESRSASAGSTAAASRSRPIVAVRSALFCGHGALSDWRGQLTPCARVTPVRRYPLYQRRNSSKDGSSTSSCTAVWPSARTARLTNLAARAPGDGKGNARREAGGKVHAGTVAEVPRIEVRGHCSPVTRHPVGLVDKQGGCAPRGAASQWPAARCDRGRTPSRAGASAWKAQGLLARCRNALAGARIGSASERIREGPRAVWPCQR